MSDLMEVYGLPFFMIDGLADYHSIGGVIRMTGYRLLRTQRGEERLPLLGIGMTAAAWARVRAEISATAGPTESVISEIMEGMTAH
jgi:hypothetical protein